MFGKKSPQNDHLVFACYPRVSTDEQAETNLSIPTQIDRCKELIARLHNAVLMKEHILPDDESGMTLERPNLQKLRELIRQGKINAVIVNSSDRLSRRPGHAELLFDEMLKHEVRLFIVMHGRELHLDNPSDRLLLLMEMGFNRQWHFMLREAMRRGQRGAAERGGVVFGGSRHYGYEKFRNPATNLFEYVKHEKEGSAKHKRSDFGTR